MRFSRLSINGRLAASMAFLGVLLIAIGAFGLVGMHDSNNANRVTYAEQMPKSIAVGEMTILVGRQRTSLDRAAINPGSDDAKLMYSKEKEVATGAEEAWAHYLSLPRDAGEDKLAAEVTTQYRATQDALTQFREATVRGDRDDILKLMVNVGTIYTRMQTAAQALKTYQLNQAKETFDAAQSHYQLFRAGSIVAILIGVLAACLSWLMLRRAILGPVNEAIGHFEAIAHGDLTHDIQVRSQDEMGRMLHGLVAMQASLTRTVESIRDGSVAIASATREVAAGNADLSARTEGQAASVEETASSAEELASTVRQNAENAERASELSSSASGIARKGHDVVSSVVSTMDEISKGSAAISEITSMIEGIAFQTNILALNAAVEAARAGEQGRGFAVVAGEVRTLAQRSSAAAKEIKELIENSTQRIATGAGQVQQAGATMNEIIDAVSRVRAIMDEITAASREQSQGVGQVSIAVNEMDQGLQQNAALVEQSAAAARALQEQAQALASTAAFFRLRADGIGARSSGPRQDEPALANGNALRLVA
ncbi:methyl-accepting chemotaxis sensory transducer [Pandoraea horticolens]|uniref:Methyl-accepting chemotaxis sensory transducer n=1 Tax=Pandoraea horticolens TaxID=2508298 RepID=A0A5E4U136_9BURK|nr:methyl-accepting chemotaxis protein [Pandoraea horticolens]VVD91869.1 methyl-accepting chemotaxis sensory transducer [Pandoraea horticolens]